MAKTDGIESVEDAQSPMEKVNAAREAMRLRLAKDTLQSVDGAEVMDKIAEEIMAAETVDEVLEGGSATAARDILNVPLTIHGFVMRPSDLPNQEAFVVCDAVREDTGEILVVTTGAYGAVAALLRIDQLGGFPVEHVMFRAAGDAIRLGKVPHETYEVPAV